MRVDRERGECDAGRMSQRVERNDHWTGKKWEQIGINIPISKFQEQLGAVQEGLPRGSLWPVGLMQCCICFSHMPPLWQSQRGQEH